MTAISTPTITINNQVINILPNSCTYDEGGGEQTIRTQSAGGGIVSNIFADNAETKFSTVKFTMINIPDNIAQARIWKFNGNANAITITSDGLARNFSAMALTNNYEVKLAATDGGFELEFKGTSAV